MGDRAQVLIKDTGVYLYTHWNAHKLQETVKKALAKMWRWDDPTYLTRIIFCEMVKGYEMEELGFGIGTKMQGDIRLLITVDSNQRTVIAEDGKKYTFNEFIDGV